jgi:hypothetical protein
MIDPASFFSGLRNRSKRSGFRGVVEQPRNLRAQDLDLASDVTAKFHQVTNPAAQGII